MLDQRRRGAFTEPAERLHDPHMFVQARTAEPRQQRRHRRGITDLAQGIDGRGAHLIVPVVEQSNQRGDRLAIAQEADGQRGFRSFPPAPRAEVTAPMLGELQSFGDR